MNFLRKQLDGVKHHFEKGGKWEKFFYMYEAFDTFLFAPNSVAAVKGVQVRDGIDMKRLMITVIIAMTPCLLFGMYNIGHQHYLALGIDAPFIDKFWIGIKQVVPIIIVSYVVGLGIEFAFTIFRKHPVNEGFLVTGMLIPLVMPPDVPLWQVGLATAFSVVIGKEAFGGTGMNILNVALTARAFLYFAYPVDMAGEVWTYLPDKTQVVAGYSGATPLGITADFSARARQALMTSHQAAETATIEPSEVNKLAASAAHHLADSLNNGHLLVDALNHSWHKGLYSFTNMFTGFIPGSVGETSTLMCLVGALILIATGVGSWKIIVSVFGGAYIMAFFLNIIGANEFMLLPAHYHLVMGGLAFGAVFMATDPVTAAHTESGKWIYGILIGIFTILIRVFNPAYPEGIMLAILLMNVFAPLIDYFVVSANKKRRLQRATV
ncbi:MAG TPA: NADH:ubiquinone reductase (Na(+)-transporting) subunit B [Cyclobacteriaceae bacterium]|nr:NADH:ubiquinone reductase (Na(+)-transporting) subunit B [Cyclobacteriaceae bacterium]